MDSEADSEADSGAGPHTDDERTERRAELLPEEARIAQGHAGADALAEQVLAESDARTEDPDAGQSGTASTGVTGDDPLVGDTD